MLFNFCSTDSTPELCERLVPATELANINVTAPDVPPPVKPSPAVTDSMSPASFVKEITPVEESYDKSPYLH